MLFFLGITHVGHSGFTTEHLPSHFVLIKFWSNLNQLKFLYNCIQQGESSPIPFYTYLPRVICRAPQATLSAYTQKEEHGTLPTGNTNKYLDSVIFYIVSSVSEGTFNVPVLTLTFVISKFYSNKIVFNKNDF